MHASRREGEIAVWYADLRRLASRYDDFHALLSPDEAVRAARYRTQALRDRCVLRRGLLRRLLGQATGRAPESLVFDYGPQGKPALAVPPGSDPLAFNLADCRDDVLIAIAPPGATGIGVDIERWRETADAEDIVRRFFAPAEREAFAAVPEAQRAQAFFNGWTRKEAFIKANGAGLSMPLDRFAVELAPGRLARLLSVDESLDAGSAADWSLFDLRPAPGTVAALALRGAGWPVPVIRDATEAVLSRP